MRKYIVVKHNLMRKQKFYLASKCADSYVLNKRLAYKFMLRVTAERIVAANTAKMSKALKEIIKYEVEAVES